MAMQCQKKLGMKITHTTGTTFHDTVYKINPWHDYPKCNVPTSSKIPYENNFYETKNSKDIMVQVDDEVPIFECGFHNVDPSNVIKKKTLFNYVCKEDENGLKDANLFHYVTVCVEDSTADLPL